MQGTFRRLASTGLMSMAIAGSVLIAVNPALALTEQEILDKLAGIPVFLIVNGEGQSLTASVGAEDEQVNVPIVFIDSEEAEGFLTEAENEGSEIANDANIVVYPLGEIYAEANSQLDGLESLVYIPSAVSVQQASQIAEQDVQGVPLYAAIDLEREQYLLTGDNTLPMFFSLADLQSQVSVLVEENPAIGEAIGVEVTTLESLLVNMEADDDDRDRILELVEFVPSSETLQFIESLSEGAEASE
ncbi:MAG: Tic22 family protein [Cyanobacteria bacterium P01_C01_bin.70]